MGLAETKESPFFFVFLNQSRVERFVKAGKWFHTFTLWQEAVHKCK